MIHPGGRVRVESFKNSSYVVSELTIDSVSPSDLGTYNCTSQSIVGTSPQRSFSIAHIIGERRRVEREGGRES